MSTTSNVLRQVGMLEKLYTARQVLGVYNSVIVTATYTIQTKLENRSLYSIFGHTIPKLIIRHPPLCCYFEGEDTPEPKFIRLNSFEVNDVLQIVDLKERETLAQRLQELHDQQWSVERKPLWKLVVMKEPHFIEDTKAGSKLHVAFVYHHVIGDGLSGTAFHRSLLLELDALEQTGDALQGPPKAIDTPVSTTLIEPIERLISLPLSWLYLIKSAAQEYIPQWLLGTPPLIWAGLPVQTLDECPYLSRARIVTIPANEMVFLLKESKEYGVTLTSLLNAAVVSVLADALPEAPSFAGNTPYTLRRMTGTSVDQMVNQTTSLETSYPATLLDRIRRASNATERVDVLWNAASYFHAQMQDELAKCPRDNLVGLLPYVVDHVNFYRKKIGKAREVTWELSNLGVFKTQEPSAGMWTLENMIFTQGATPVGAAFSVNCASIQGGLLTLAITWQESVVHEDIIKALARYFADLPRFLQHERFI